MSVSKTFFAVHAIYLSAALVLNVTPSWNLPTWLTMPHFEHQVQTLHIACRPRAWLQRALWCVVPVWTPLRHTGVHPAVLGQHMRPHLPQLPAALAQSVENYVDWLLELLVLPPTNRQMPMVLASWQATLRQLCWGYQLNWRQTFVVYALDFVPSHAY